MSIYLKFGLAAVIAYLLGSISFGILVSKIFHGPDLRAVGSKNTGATNVQRTMGWGPGLLTFLGDALKAVLACWVGEKLTGSNFGALVCGLFVVIGHNWPVFFQFKGGKGVASSCGVMLYCFPIPAMICFAAGVIVIWGTKFVSLGSLTVLTLYAVLVALFFASGDVKIILWAIALAALCVYRHRENIRRLLQGKERKLGQKVS